MEGIDSPPPIVVARFVWVKGHADNIHNNRCDQLATQAADTADILVDEGYINNLSTNSEDSIFE